MRFSARQSARRQNARRGGLSFLPLRVEPLEDRCLLSVVLGHQAQSDAGHSTALYTDTGLDDAPPMIADGQSQRVIGPHHADPGHAGTQSHFFAETGDDHHFAWQDQDLSTPDVIDINYDFRNIGGRWGRNLITPGQITMTELALTKWEEATNGKIKFSINTQASAADILIIGTGSLRAFGYPSRQGGVLGLGGGTYTHNSDHTITSGIAWMDSAETWDEVNGNGNPSGTFDYFTVVAQEIGHALGLGHVDDLNGTNIMNGSYTGEVAEYSTNDAEHIQSVYGVSGPVDGAPTVEITSPGNDTQFDSGAMIDFVGMATDAEDGDLTAGLVWTSSIDGDIGTGDSFSTTLTDGNHTITASVTDLGGKTTTQSVSILVGDAPAEATSVSVDSITYALEGGKSGDKHLSVTVAIVDDLGVPPSGASVSIRLSTSKNTWIGTATTGTDGTVTFTLKNARTGSYTTEVTDVTADGLTWDGLTPTNGFEKSSGKSSGATAETPADASHVVLLAAELEHHVEGTNWIDPNLPKGHNRHTDHVSWDTDPTSSNETVNVSVWVHNHGNLDADRQARMNAAIAEVNSAAANFGVDLNLVAVTDGSENIHLHEDTTSGCGGGALGCAEFSIFINHTGKFDDGHGNHLFAGEDVGGTAEATVLSGFNWYTGDDDPTQIGADQYDYQTVVTQELLHLVGLHHDSTVYDSDSETIGNTDRRSVMHGSLPAGVVRRFMSTHDQEILGHLYGPGQPSSEDGGGGGGGGGNGPPQGRGRRSSLSSSALAADFTALPNLLTVSHASRGPLLGLKKQDADPALFTQLFEEAAIASPPSLVTALAPETSRHDILDRLFGEAESPWSEEGLSEDLPLALDTELLDQLFEDLASQVD